MLVLACERDTVISIGSNVTIRVVSIGEEMVELEVDAPGDIEPEPDVISMKSKSRRGVAVGSFTRLRYGAPYRTV